MMLGAFDAFHSGISFYHLSSQYDPEFLCMQLPSKGEARPKTVERIFAR
jgi:hypothetical protein